MFTLHGKWQWGKYGGFQVDMEPKLWFSKRCIKSIKMTLNSDNMIVRTIINVGLNGTHSILCGNLIHLRSKYGMEECIVMKCWNEKFKNECESVRVCEHIIVIKLVMSGTVRKNCLEGEEHYFGLINDILLLKC